MNEEILPIGIDSTVEHVQSETGRIDGLFTVPTGSIGSQQVNYHPIEEERQRYSLILPPTEVDSSIPVKKKSSLAKETYANAIWIATEPSQRREMKTNGSIDQEPSSTARFSLPEMGNIEALEKVFSPKTNPRPSENRVTGPLRSLFKSRSRDPSTSNEKVNIAPSIIEIPDQCRLPSSESSDQDDGEGRLPFLSLEELWEHNHRGDAWISLFGQIYDITELIERAKGTPIFDQYLQYAGEDLSHLFDEETKEPRWFIDPHTHQPMSVMKNLSLIESMDLSFWNRSARSIGHLIVQPRWIRLRYVSFPERIHLVQVDEEETVRDIARKLLRFNRHIYSYRWRYDGRTFDFNKTLTENGLVNDETFHDQHGWRSDQEHCPTILLDYIDDLTIA